MLGFGFAPLALRPGEAGTGTGTSGVGGGSASGPAGLHARSPAAAKEPRAPGLRRARMCAATDGPNPDAGFDPADPVAPPATPIRDFVDPSSPAPTAADGQFRAPVGPPASAPDKRPYTHPQNDKSPPDLILPAAVRVAPPKPWDTTTGAEGISYLERRMAFSRRRTKVLRKAYSECERITRIYSKTFYLGSSLLPIEKRRAVWAIYVWCRRTDELVDGPRVNQRSADLVAVLEEWEVRLERAFAGEPYDALDLTLSDVKDQFPTLDIVPFKDMIRGMLMDVRHDRYDTFRDLYVYCYRVASTVGLMTLPIMGAANEEEAIEPATALGIALQLTNILRDVGEDRLRGRIYLPLEDLARFNYTEEDLMRGVLDDRYRRLMKFQIARARKYFAIAESGISMLAEEARLPVRASLDMYSQILDALENNGYDNFTKRAYITKSQKFFTLPLSVLRIQPAGSLGKMLSAVIAPFFKR